MTLFERIRDSPFIIKVMLSTLDTVSSKDYAGDAIPIALCNATSLESFHMCILPVVTSTDRQLQIPAREAPQIVRGDFSQHDPAFPRSWFAPDSQLPPRRTVHDWHKGGDRTGASRQRDPHRAEHQYPQKKYIVADCKVGVEGAKGIAELLAQNRTIADLRMGIFWYQNNHMGRVLRYRRRGLRVRLWVSGAQQFARNTESQYAI